MIHRLEIALKPDLYDAEGAALQQQARRYFNIDLTRVRTATVLTIDADLTPYQLDTIQRRIFCNPVTQVSSYAPLALDFDWLIWVGLRPGVRDNAGATAIEAVEDLLKIKFLSGQGIYTSKMYAIIAADLTAADADRLAGRLLANDIIQQWRIISRRQWDPLQGIGYPAARVMLDHQPTVATLSIESDAALQQISDARNLALNPNDIPVIRNYFIDPAVRAERAVYGLTDPTDVELEYISQGRSDHCNHNTFGGFFNYQAFPGARVEAVDNLFKTFIQLPTLALKAQKDWVISVLWDNAGIARFDDDHYYVITGETHNSPSNMEAYGGAITGIVGVYRDPMGTGLGARLIMGGYGYCTGPIDYTGPLKPHLHPRRLLDGVIAGVKDGGNKSGIPTTFGQVFFDDGYLGKSLVFVTALGLLPVTVEGRPIEHKRTDAGDLMVMCGGRIGKDGIHGVTASSEVFSEHTPAGHVQIGDPYTQKKMHDFLLEARDAGLIKFITDNGGGGLSSSVGESARFSNGCRVFLEKAPLKYDGLDQWEIWVSESQERMTVAVRPTHIDAFMTLAARHAVESTVIGEYTDSGKLHITYNDQTCAFVDIDLLTGGFPQWRFDAVWQPPDMRDLAEPVLGLPQDWNSLLKDLLARPNLCAKTWVARQYDHEVQGTSVIKPLVGRQRDMPSDAAVSRPVLTAARGLAFAQALLPFYSAIDAYHMTACTIDEAVRRVIAVGGDPETIGGVDNFCWPNIQYDPMANPDGKFKAAQLVRACRALREVCLAYAIPLLSGKDSMYVDGHLPGAYGETHKVSALETLQFSTTAIVPDWTGCNTMEAKVAGDWVYVIGLTRNELGASEYYAQLGYIGLHVPQVDAESFRSIYQALAAAIARGLTASVHGVYRGGLAIHLALVAMGGGLGLKADLSQVPLRNVERDDQLLFSESAGRFIVTVDPASRSAFERHLAGMPVACVGRVTEQPRLQLSGLTGPVIDADIFELKTTWQRPFGEMI